MNIITRTHTHTHTAQYNNFHMLLISGQMDCKETHTSPIQACACACVPIYITAKQEIYVRLCQFICAILSTIDSALHFKMEGSDILYTQKQPSMYT